MQVATSLVRRARTGAIVTVLVGTFVVVGHAPGAGAAATTIVVNRNSSVCSDSGPGTSAQPLCTITRAAQIAVAGQTVSIASGTYGGDISPARSGTSGAPITFQPAAGATVTVSGGSNGFRISGRSFITILLINVTGTSSYGINVSSSASITLVGNRVSNSGRPVSGRTARGIRLSDTSRSVLWANTADHNSDAGIGISGSASDNNFLLGNTAYANARGYVRAAAGFDIRDGSGNTLVANVSHDNEDSGFNVWDNSSGTLLLNASAYANGDHGIDVHDASGATVVANTVYGNVDSGIEVTTSTGTTIANNISADNGINSPRTSGNLRVDSSSAAATNLDDDLVFLRVAGVMIDWAGTRYSSLAAFRSATGREPHGVQADPRFVASSSGNFHLRAGSGAIDNANSGAPSQPGTDADSRARFDDPATANTGRGPLRYVDRGAFEFRP